jgi:hypothetical protein
VNDVENLEKMSQDLNNIAGKIEVNNPPAGAHLRTAVREIREAINELGGSYSPPSPDLG